MIRGLCFYFTKLLYFSIIYNNEFCKNHFLFEVGKIIIFTHKIVFIKYKSNLLYLIYKIKKGFISIRC